MSWHFKILLEKVLGAFFQTHKNILLPLLVYQDGNPPSNTHPLLLCPCLEYPDSRSQDQNIPRKVWNLKCSQCKFL